MNNPMTDVRTNVTEMVHENVEPYFMKVMTALDFAPGEKIQNFDEKLWALITALGTIDPELR
jgi:hypothetical protein